MIATKGNATSVNCPSVAETYSETAASWSFTSGQDGTIRWYDPVVGRWLSKDPIGISGGLNQYVFCGNNPVNLRDPFGLCEDPWYKKTWNTVKGWPGAAWRGATRFQFEGRDAMNGPHPTYPQVTTPGSGWELLPPEMSVFHDNGIGKPELKFIHPDGREAVFDGDSLQPMTDARYKGTYNYVAPANKPDSWRDVGGWTDFAGKGLGHTVTDVVPYFILGKRNERNQ